MLRHWLLLVAYCTAVFCLPFPAPSDDETDSEASRKVLGSSVVTSVSVIMDLGNGTKKYYADAAGNPVPKPTSASMLGSPPDLLHPDRYEFYTFNEAGDLVKRLMTLEEIQGIIATGDGEGGELPPNYYHQELPTGLKSPTLLGEGEIGELSSPVEGVHEVVESVQNVLKEEMQAAKNKTPSGTTPRPTTAHFSTWTSEELMDTSTSVRSSTATTPTTFRPSSKKPAKRPSTHRPSLKPPTSTSRTTSLPSSTTASPQKISRKPVSPSSRLPTRKPTLTTTESPQRTTHSSTVRYSTTVTSTTTPTTTEKVPEKEESSSKIPVTGDIDGNLLDNEVSFASASNINTEILNKTKNNSDDINSTEAIAQTFNGNDEAVSKNATSSGVTVSDKTTEKPTEKYPDHSVESNFEYSGDASITSIQNIKPSVTVIANSTINTISVQTSTGKPNFQNVANQNKGGNGNSESSHTAGETSANKNSSTTIQNVEPMVTIIVNSAVNTASASTTVKDPVSAQPLMNAIGLHKPGVSNLHARPSSTVTEKIAPEDSSEEIATTDSSSEENSSSEEDSSENSNSVESVSTEFPDDILSTLLHILGADVTTQSSEEHGPTVDAKTNDTKASSMTASHQADTDMGLGTPAIITDSTENIASLPSEINSVNTTKNVEYLKPKPLTNDSLFIERNQSISSIVEMLMDNKLTAGTIDNLIAAQNSLSSKDNFSVSLQEETKISPTTYLIPPKESVQNNSVKVTASNETTENFGTASSESGTVVLYANDLLAQTDKPKIQFTPTESSLINSTTKASSTVETTMKILEAVESTTYGLTDTDSEKHAPSELSTEAQTSTTKFNKNTEKSSLNNTDRDAVNTNVSHSENKITAPSEIDEVIEKQTISPDSYFVIPGIDNAVEETDFLTPPVQQNLDSSAIDTDATNESEIQNTGESTNIKSAVVHLNQTEKHTTIVPHDNAEITTKLMETVDGSEKLHTTSIMSMVTTKKPAVINTNLSDETVVAHSAFVPLKISPDLAESVSNVLSQVSNKTATTILTTDKETTFDVTTQITTTNLDDSATMPFMASTMVNEVEQSSTLTPQVKTTKGNITGMLHSANIQTVLQDENVSQGPLDTAESNTAVNTVTTSVQETTTNLYAAETMSIISMDTKVQDKNEATVAPILEYKNETGTNEVIKEDTKEIEMETKVNVKNRGNASDENLSMMAVHENVLKQAESGLSVRIQAQNETLAAASSVVEEHTGLRDRHNGSSNRPQENAEGTTVTLQETTTPKLAESAEETSTVLFTETSNDVTTATVQMAKNKPQDITGVPDAAEQTTTLLPVPMSADNLATDKLLLASQIKGTQVKLIDGEEHLLKVDTITAPNKESGASGAASQTVEEMSTPAWQKIFDSSENEVNKSTSIKPAETTPFTESINETNYIDITRTDSNGDVKNATEANSTSDLKVGDDKHKIESVLENGNSIVSDERTKGTSESNTNKSTSTIIAVPGITQAIFHTEEDDRLASTEEPTITTTDLEKMVAETILPSRFVESIASSEATGAEEMSTQAAGSETAAETEGAGGTEKTWAPVSTAVPPQTKPTTSRTADQTTKAHADMRVTTLGDVRRPAQSLPVELGPAPEENLGLEATALGLDKDVSDFADLCNELALRLWKPVANKRATVSRSLVVSPFAVTSLLAMVFLGARGGTSGQMNDILRLDDMVTFNPHQVFRNVTASLVMTKNPGVATAAFVRELYSDKTKGKLLDFYKERAQQFYDGHVEEVNFNMVGDVVRRRTNLLVKRQTSGRVAEYIRGSNIMLRPPLSVFSANIFQTDCGLASTSGRDGEMYFTVVPASRQRRLVPVPAAVWRSGFLAGYEPVLDATVAALGDGDSTVSTVLVLPGQQSHTAPGDSVAALEDRLWNSPWSERAWSRLLRTLLPRPGLELQLPRFSHRSMLNLTATLQKMGLQDLFSEGRADLKGLNGLANDLHLSDIVQVNTFGTCGELVADARHHVEVFPSTSQRVGRRGDDDDDGDGDLHRRASELAGIPLALRPRQARLPDAPRLRFDRPFLYAVRHNPTGLLLHMGRFNPRLVR